jgi:phenylalanyl-tRNA synthetase beta chain
MNVSYRWLRSLAPDLELSAPQVAERLASLGAPADEMTRIGEALRDVVIARVKSVQRHPNADRLSLCEVDAGNGVLQVVCGAPNVAADTLYPFAPVGANLPGGIQIKKAKIRGTESQGMICSASELGLGRDNAGVLELVGDYAPGSSFIESVDLDDVRLLLDIGPNRGDLLSHWGIARELVGQDRLVLPNDDDTIGFVQTTNDGKASGISIRIDDPDACFRYIGVAIEGVKIAPSPAWLMARLRAIGSRPINNVVDVTNFVLHELGQPMHAFDAKLLSGDQIIVRRARDGEPLVTLDGVERKLRSDMLVIADGERATAIAGVMGGRDSEVSANTTSVLLECALFEPKQVRATRTALGMSTDASYRFERGVDPEMMERAVRRALSLIMEIAGGKIAGATDVYPKPIENRTIKLRPSRVEKLLGVPMDAAQLQELLEPVGFSVTGSDDNAIDVVVPGHRHTDVTREVDLIEEVARRHGFDNFPTELLPFRPSVVPEDPVALLEDELRTYFVGRGFLEARTAPFAPESEGDVALMLPLASTESRLRRALIPGLLRRVEYNFNRGARNIRLFEIGTAFAPGKNGTPEETTRAAAVFTGLREPAHWTGNAQPYDIWDVKGMADEIARTFVGAQHVTADRLDAGSIDAPAWAGEIFGVEFVLPATGIQRARTQFTPLPQYPAIEQDMALLLPEALASDAVVQTIRSLGGQLLESVEPFDLYRGKGIPEGTRSIAYRLRFRATDRTLTDAEVDAVVKRVLGKLREEHGVERRG